MLNDRGGRSPFSKRLLQEAGFSGARGRSLKPTFHLSVGSPSAGWDSYFPAQKACVSEGSARISGPSIRGMTKPAGLFPAGRRHLSELSAGGDYSADCLVMALLILTRLSAITPRPTQRCIPASPL